MTPLFCPRLDGEPLLRQLCGDIIARSAIGVGHLQMGLPCQDDAGCLEKGDYLIGVVADGAGSAKFSDIGSRCLVKTVLQFVKENELLPQNSLNMWQFLNTDITKFFVSTNSKFPIDKDVRSFFEKMVNECLKSLTKEAEKNHCDL